MAYLNHDERERLRNELMGMSYRSAKGRLNSIDPNARLAYWRNVQRVGEWHTRFILEGLGTQVDLVETVDENPTSRDRIKRRKYNMVDVRVAPLPNNKS